MKNLLIICGLALVIYGCGKDGGSTTVNTGINGMCGAGQVSTMYGCLAQGSCPVGQGQHPTMGCVQGTMNNQYGMCQMGQVNTQFGCLSQGSCGFGMGQHPQYGCVQGTMNNQYGYNNYQSYYGYGWQYSYPNMQWQMGYPNSRCQFKSWYWYCY